jgi:hypothetical protein
VSRIGPHILNWTVGAKRWAENAPIVKVCTPTALDAFRVAQPDAIRVYRKYWDSQQTWVNGADLARQVLDELKGYRHARLYVELYNEMDRGDTLGQARQFREAAAVLHPAGIKLAGPSWATGAYERENWRAFIDETRGAVDALAVHAYWSPLHGFTVWNALRFAGYWQPGDPPVLITECGQDIVRDAPGGLYAGRGGWRKNEREAGNTDGARYIAELIEYNRRLEALPYVLGATVFTAGAEPGQWTDYDTDGLDLSALYATGPVSDAAPDAPSNPGGQTVSDYTSPNNSGAFAKPPTQIVVHATRGGTVGLESEFDATVNWFDNPQSGVSAHAVVSPTRTARPVPPDRIAWHCLTRNRISLGIEFCQARLGDAIPDAELRRGAEVCAEWCVRYGIPTVWALDRGFAQHKDTPEGQQVGKSDIGPGFDGDRFMAYVRAEVTRLTAPKPDPVTDALNGCWHFATMVEAAPTLAAAKQAATSLKAEVVELKQALGRA